MSIGILMLCYLLFAVFSFCAAVSGRRIWFWLAVFAGLALLAFHGFLIVLRGIQAGHAPWSNTYETLILLSFLMMAIYWLTFRKFRALSVGGFAGLTAAVLLGLSSLLSPEIEPLLPALKSNWLLFHVTAAIIGYASFAVAFGAAGIYLFLDAARGFLAGRPEMRGQIDARLEYLDRLMTRLIAAGFAFLTLGISTGAVWANVSWGRYWNWDPKETWAFITWALYGVCHHVRSQKNGSGRGFAWLAFLGFFLVMFTYFGVNFWLASLHAYS
jgi:cytochrome c-type biogenesis protein CcsB